MKKREYEELKSKVKELQEQLDNAEIEDDNPFDVKDGEYAYYNNIAYITADRCSVWIEGELNEYIPCKDKSIVEARQRNHKLYDMLQRKAVETEASVTDEMWENEYVEKWYIYYNHKSNKYDISYAYTMQHISTIYFTSPEVAERAMKEIVEPFMRGEL